MNCLDLRVDESCLINYANDVNFQRQFKDVEDFRLSKTKSNIRAICLDDPLSVLSKHLF